MNFNIETKNEDGEITGGFKLSKNEASFVLTVGLNYLAANGAMPLFTGKDDEELGIVAPSTETVQ